MENMENQDSSWRKWPGGAGGIVIAVGLLAGLWADLPGIIATLFNPRYRDLVSVLALMVLASLTAGAVLWVAWRIYRAVYAWRHRRPAMRLKGLSDTVRDTRTRHRSQLHRTAVLLGEYKIPTPPVPKAVVGLVAADDETYMVWREFLGRLAPYVEVGDLRTARGVWPQLEADVAAWKDPEHELPSPPEEGPEGGETTPKNQ